MSARALSSGARVRVRPNAPHTFRAFLGREGEVVDRQTLGGQEWLRLLFDDGRMTWLPVERLELEVEG